MQTDHSGHASSPHPSPGQIPWGSVPFLRACIVLVAIQLGSLFFGGIGIYLIVMGLYVAVRRPLIYWERTRPWVAGFMGVPLPATIPAQPSTFWRVATSLIHTAISLLFLIIGLYMSWIGVKMILQDGFLHQNLIYGIFLRK